MKNLPKAKLLITSLFIISPILIGLICWERLPETIATHFDHAGKPNGWSSKEFTVFGLPLFILGCHLLCVFATSADPKREKISETMFSFILWICPIVSLFCAVGIYGNALGFAWNLSKLGFIMVGLVLIIVGNYLPKCRQNYTVGIKLPWTLADEDNWNRTHRLSGWLFIFGGLIMLFNIFINIPWLTFAVLMLLVLIPSVYSYVLYIQSKK